MVMEVRGAASIQGLSGGLLPVEYQRPFLHCIIYSCNGQTIPVLYSSGKLSFIAISAYIST
jgi:hypothetical protein